MSNLGNTFEFGCGKARTLMPEMLDGSLTASQATSLRAHIDSCEDCGARFATFAEFDAALLGLGEALRREIVPPLGSRERLARSLDAPAQRRHSIRSLAAVAAMLVAAVATWIVTAGKNVSPLTHAEARFIDIWQADCLRSHRRHFRIVFKGTSNLGVVVVRLRIESAPI